MHDIAAEQRIHQKFCRLLPSMNERVRRHWAAAEATVLGRGGIALVARAPGLSRTTIRTGIRQLKTRKDSADVPPLSRVRRPGGGPKPIEETDPTLVLALDELVAPETRGDPMSPLRWTLKSTSQLAKALTGQGHPVSVDAKKKEWVGDFRTGGGEWQPRGELEQVRVYDFVDKPPDKGRVTPYGVYDLTANERRVSVGTGHDTARFAAQTIGKWWRGLRPLPAGEGIAGHRRRRRLQLKPMPPLEDRVAGVGRRDGSGIACVPLPAGHEQVEQDRTPIVLSRDAELARQAADQP